MKNNFTILLLILSLLIAYSCKNEELERKTQLLKEIQDKQKQDSLLLVRFNFELSEIYTALDSVASFDQTLRNTSNIKKQDALSKIKVVDSLLKVKSMRIDSLTTALQNIKSKFTQNLAVGEITEGKEKLELKRAYFRDLQDKINALEADNFNLKEIIKQKDDQLLEKDNVISQVIKEREAQQKRLDDLNLNLLKREMELTELNKNTSDTYFALAKEVRDIADKTSPIFNKKKKEELVTMAHDYFLKSAKMGSEKAKKELDIMKNDKKYNKFIKTAINKKEQKENKEEPKEVKETGQN